MSTVADFITNLPELYRTQIVPFFKLDLPGDRKHSGGYGRFSGRGDTERYSAVHHEYGRTSLFVVSEYCDGAVGVCHGNTVAGGEDRDYGGGVLLHDGGLR